MHPNYPNPFNAETTIGFDIAEATQVTIRLYDMLGREAARIMNAAYPVGSHTLAFNAAGLATGNYLLRMSTATGFQQVRRITLLK
ncbi:T9SS type A sorting domain-containing protein [bacterium]|nr:T9SS type A sorting domain-containing protein [bacterium]